MPNKTVPLTFQPTAADFYDAVVWANQNSGDVFRFEFPNGYIEFQINTPVPPPPPPFPPPPVPGPGGIIP